MSNLAKFAADNLDYGFDWTNYLGSDTIQTATISATPSGLTVGGTTFFGYIVKAMISGGVDDTSYQVLCVVTTTAGLTVNSQFTLDVRAAR